MAADPIEMIRDIKRSLDRRGFLLLSTPNTDTLKGSTIEAHFSILSPGVHKIIFSEKGLKILLANAGFSNVIIQKTSNQLFAFASEESILTKSDFLQYNRDAVLQYFTKKISELPVSSSYFRGIWYRLFRSKIDHGEYEPAFELLQQAEWFEIWTESEIADIHTSDKLFELNSFADSIIYYYAGILCLNYNHKPEYAVRFFHLSFLLCNKMIHLHKGMCALEEDIIWLAKLHVAISKLYIGEVEEALQDASSILLAKSNKPEHLPEVPDYILSRVEEILSTN